MAKEDPNPTLGAEADEHVADIEQQLMTLIRSKIVAMGWNQSDAARAMHTYQPKVSAIARATEPKNPLSLEKLIKCAYRIGVEFQVVETPKFRSDSYPPLPPKDEDKV